MASDKPFFLVQNEGFTFAGPEHDLLHPHDNAVASGDTVTETQYFGFSVPEAKLNALCYLWHHPNLNVVTGGVWVWQGIKRYGVQSELLDIRSFMNDSALKDDLHHFRLDNSYSVRIIEPMKAFHLTYADEGRRQMIDLQIEAVSPAVLFADGKHFEQVMRVRGDITIRGHSHKVDCFNVRDRSWGKPRPEQSMTLPPMSWTTAVFNEGFSVNCNVFDQVECNPELRGSVFEVPRERTLLGGWTWKDGEIGQMIAATKRVVRDTETLIPLEVTLDLADSLGREFHMTGELVANCPWQTWPNVNMSMSLMKWRCEDMETHGDCQEAIFGDYYNFRTRTG